MAILSIRLDEDLEDRLDLATQQTGRRRSDVVRDLLRGLPSRADMLTARQRYERVKHLIGAVDSGVSDLGSNHEAHLRRIFDAKRDDIMGRRPADRAD